MSTVKERVSEIVQAKSNILLKPNKDQKAFSRFEIYLFFSHGFFGDTNMTAVSLKLPDEVVDRLDKLAKLTGRSKTSYMIEAITEHLDDLEDLYLAEQRLLEVKAGRSKTHTLEDVERSLGLAD
ncbi:MAG: DUF6290 family protein [Methylococcales bacterium]|nr:DUF6290 family protein [Methylococcales bacterium]